MREIKFRGLSVNGKTFVGNLTILRKRWDHLEEGYYISNSAGMPFAYQVRPETIGEYTGLKDKNEKEIFEGDIVSCMAAPSGKSMTQSKKMTGKIVYSGWSFTVSLWHKDTWWAYGALDFSTLEVIGNIHENYDLLEVKPAVTQWNLETPKCKCGGKVILTKETYRCDCGNVFTKL